MDIKLKLDFAIDPLDIKLKHGEKATLLGSCFSSEIGHCFSENGFDVLSNPLGTIFHPVPLAAMISDTLSDKKQEDLFPRNDLFFSWDAAGTIFGFSEAELEVKINAQRQQLKSYLQTSRYLFVTLGSTFAYVHNDSKKIVANCHKMPGNIFTKELTELNLMVEMWIETLSQIRVINPEIQVVFTVSPVRHVKDGLTENNRSKARLFELIQALQNNSGIHYFPSYEIVMDELRDYRFYKTDGIHPNQQAIDYVWSRLGDSIFDSKTRALCQEVVLLRQMENHIPLLAGSMEAERFQIQKVNKISKFLEENPSVNW